MLARLQRPGCDRLESALDLAVESDLGLLVEAKQDLGHDDHRAGLPSARCLAACDLRRQVRAREVLQELVADSGETGLRRIAAGVAHSIHLTQSVGGSRRPLLRA